VHQGIALGRGGLVAEHLFCIRRGMPLADVALACGFADQSHLTRRFKGSVGATPAAWRTMSGVPALSEN
jgi:AraC-like DNA-binding protein